MLIYSIDNILNRSGKLLDGTITRHVSNFKGTINDEIDLSEWKIIEMSKK